MGIAKVSATLDAFVDARNRKFRNECRFYMAIIGGMCIALTAVVTLHGFGPDYVFPAIALPVGVVIVCAGMFLFSLARHRRLRKTLRGLVDLHVIKRTWMAPNGMTGVAIASHDDGLMISLCFDTGMVFRFPTGELLADNRQCDVANDDAISSVAVNEAASGEMNSPSHSAMAAVVEKLRAYKETSDRGEKYGQLCRASIISGPLVSILIASPFTSYLMSSDATHQIGRAFFFLYVTLIPMFGILSWLTDRKKKLLGESVDPIVARDFLAMQVATPSGAIGRIEEVYKDEFASLLRFKNGSTFVYPMDTLMPASVTKAA